MAGDPSRWFVMNHVNLDPVKAAFPQIIWQGEDEVSEKKEKESTLMIFADGRAMSYNFNNGTSMELCDLKPKRFTSHCCINL